MASLTCRAKVNLFLHILGKRSDNYHILESLVTFADFGDELNFELNETALSLEIVGPYADELNGFDKADNLIILAAQAFERQFDLQVKGAFKLTKNLPVASGIGGGSANAAGAVELLMQAYDKVANVDDLLVELSADVPVCFRGKNVIMSGIGEGLDEWPNMPQPHAVLVNPNKAVSTAKIFIQMNASIDIRPYDFVTGDVPKFVDVAQMIDFLKLQGNDMQPAAIDICPEIGDVLKALNECNDVMLARMSGSGATCFGLFATAKQAKNAALKLSNIYPNWWVVPTMFSG